MAMDTADKRRSSQSFGAAWNAGTLIPAASDTLVRRASPLGVYGDGRTEEGALEVVVGFMIGDLWLTTWVTPS